MGSPWWTVGKVADVLERFRLTRQHALIDQVRILHQHQWLAITVRDNADSEPEEIVVDFYGVVHPEREEKSA